MAIHITAPAQPSGAKINPHFAIEVIPLPGAVRNNQNLPAFVIDHYANTHQIRKFFPSLEERLRRQSLIHEATREGTKDVLMARVFFLRQEIAELGRHSEQQSRRQAMLQSIDNGLDLKLDCLNARKKASVVFFALAAAISAATAVTAVNVNPKRIAAAAVATAATVLIGTLGKEIHSFLKKRESAVKKKRVIISAMLTSAKIMIKDLTEVYDLAYNLQSETACIWEMVDDGATDVAVREKVSALNNSFRELQRKANNCSWDVSSATEFVLERIIRDSSVYFDVFRPF